MLIKEDICTGCRACEAVCRNNSITMVRNEEGFLFPKVHHETCIKCNACIKVCPVLKKEFIKAPVPKAYAVINKDEQIRMNSSSGGVFYLLAKWAINNGGVVFGAKFNEKFEVIHDYTETLEGVEPFMGSKYVQSNMGNCYIVAKEFLDAGRIVLFSGTPCQIGGLKAYLKKEYDNLFCQDLICHGVPSPLVWQKYVEYREKEAASETRRIFFRQKKYGWKKHSLRFEFADCKEYQQRADEDLYMQSFLRNLCLRKSCYHCNFKTVNRQADITLADFWGVNKLCAEMNDDKGTSLIIVHSEKGERIFDWISSKTVSREVDLSNAACFNSAMIQSVNVNKQRNRFLKKIQSKPFDKAYKQCTKVGFIKRAKMIVRPILAPCWHWVTGKKHFISKY